MIKRLLSIICFFCISFLYSYELVFASPINGECAPTHYNCKSGDVSGAYQDTLAWKWNCLGSNGGYTAYCSEAIPAASGGCGSSLYTCSSGVWDGGKGSGGCTDGKTYEYYWNCNGAGGGSNVTCYQFTPMCGTANGGSFTSLSSDSSDLCYSCHGTKQFATANFVDKFSVLEDKLPNWSEPILREFTIPPEERIISRIMLFISFIFCHANVKTS